MYLKVLVDNHTYIDQYYLGEPAVSYYIEDEGEKILLDLGYSDLFLKNAKAFGLNLEEVSTIVFSHGHDDHTGGLQYFLKAYENKNRKIVAHPDAFFEKVHKDVKICAPIREEELKTQSNLILSKEPVWVSQNIVFLGEIPTYHDFEKRKVIGEQKINEVYTKDYVMDDSALAFKGKNGIYIITGCSHSGICNIITHANKVCGADRVLGILGGFHLFEKSQSLENTIEFLKKNKITQLLPCHCTSFEVRAEMHKHMPLKEVGVGLELYWE